VLRKRYLEPSNISIIIVYHQSGAQETEEGGDARSGGEGKEGKTRQLEMKKVIKADKAPKRLSWCAVERVLKVAVFCHLFTVPRYTCFRSRGATINRSSLDWLAR
jgi:hypothetical protein